MIARRTEQWKYVICDWLTANVAFFMFSLIRARFHLWIRYQQEGDNIFDWLFSSNLVAEQIIFPLVMLGVYWLSGYYSNPFNRSRLQEFTQTFSSTLVNTLLIFIIILANDTSDRLKFNLLALALLFGVLFSFTYLGRYMLSRYRRGMIRSGRWRFKAAVVGLPEDVGHMCTRLRNSWSGLGFDVRGVVLLNDEYEPDDNLSSRDVHHDLKANNISYDTLVEMCRTKQIEQVLLATSDLPEHKMMGLLKRLFPLNTSIKINPALMSLVTSGVYLHDIYGEPFVDLTRPRMSHGALNVKRLADVTVSAIALLLLSPLMAILAYKVKKSSPGPIFYSQLRVGKHGKPFKIYKFRTMVNNAEPNGPSLSSDGDSRITPSGAWMRKYRLDELPQFWNVIKGDMSLVGPRPEREYFTRQIVEEAPYYTLVLQVRPGITSWGMVKYGYASSVKQMIERTRYDILYLSNMSLMLDMKILIHTVRTVVLGKGK